MKDLKLFDNRPQARSRKLNILPDNPEKGADDKAVGPGRFPSWLHIQLPKGSTLWNTGKELSGKRLHTVCEEARCPNLVECWSKKTATFLVMGKACTRSCGFCSISHSLQPPDLEADEPERVAESVAELGLRHVVITMVARDDLPDGGAAHLSAVVKAIRIRNPGSVVELLTSDFQGNQAAWDTILDSKPEIFNYNIETVRSLTPRVRHTATYDRTLEFLQYVHQRRQPGMLVKSGIMLGLGEEENEVVETLGDLKNAGCDIVTMGQYLQPDRHKLRVKAFIPPEQFKKYESLGYALGIKYMYCGPFVRSSYNADLVIESLIQKSKT